MLQSNQYDRRSDPKDRWIGIAFPVTVVSIVVGITIPALLIQVAKYFNIKLGSFSNIVICMLLVQVFFITPSIIISALSSQDVPIKEKLGLINWKFGYLKDACIYELVLILPLYLIAVLVHSVSSHFGVDTSSPLDTLLSSATLNGKILVLLLTVFFVPFVEEVVFRRLIFTFVNKLLGTLPSVLITSFAFAVLHGGVVQLIPLMILGIALQKLYLKHNSLYPSILLHSLHNLITMTIFLIIF